MRSRLRHHAWMKLGGIFQGDPFPGVYLSRRGDWGENDIGALFLHL